MEPKQTLVIDGLLVTSYLPFRVKLTPNFSVYGTKKDTFVATVEVVRDATDVIHKVIYDYTMLPCERSHDLISHILPEPYILVSTGPGTADLREAVRKLKFGKDTLCSSCIHQIECLSANN